MLLSEDTVTLNDFDSSIEKQRDVLYPNTTRTSHLFSKLITSFLRFFLPLVIPFNKKCKRIHWFPSCSPLRKLFPHSIVSTFSFLLNLLKTNLVLVCCLSSLVTIFGTFLFIFHFHFTDFLSSVLIQFVPLFRLSSLFCVVLWLLFVTSHYIKSQFNQQFDTFIFLNYLSGYSFMVSVSWIFVYNYYKSKLEFNASTLIYLFLMYIFLFIVCLRSFLSTNFPHNNLFKNLLKSPINLEKIVITDILTSLIKCFLDCHHVIALCFSRSLIRFDLTFSPNMLLKFLIVSLPAGLRIYQCIVKINDEIFIKTKNKSLIRIFLLLHPHSTNILKYITIIFANLVSINSHNFLIVSFFVLISLIFSFFFDVFIDWKLASRQRLSLFDYFGVVFNAGVRLTSFFILIFGSLRSTFHPVVLLLPSILELCRRAIWVVLRVGSG
ncbi:hypothetical protein RCL1_003677 [Eukaryota sp. TZLM3-RCL]